jgi:hypothetical protein
MARMTMINKQEIYNSYIQIIIKDTSIVYYNLQQNLTKIYVACYQFLEIIISRHRPSTSALSLAGQMYRLTNRVVMSFPQLNKRKPQERSLAPRRPHRPWRQIDDFNNLLARNGRSQHNVT